MASGDITGKGEKIMSFDHQTAPRPHQYKILQACQQHAQQYIEGVFKRLVDKLDDLLFERGNKGGEDANAFMDAARELRLNRQDLSRAFLDNFSKTYQSRLKRDAFVTAKAKPVFRPMVATPGSLESQST